MVSYSDSRHYQTIGSIVLFLLQSASIAKGTQSKSKRSYRVPTSTDWRPGRTTARLLISGKAYIAQYEGSTNTMTIARGSTNKIFKSIEAVEFSSTILTSAVIQRLLNNGSATPFVIPSFIWDWLTGTEGQCCDDCFATHRNLGLPCSADSVCCFGGCSVWALRPDWLVCSRSWPIL